MYLGQICHVSNNYTFLFPFFGLLDLSRWKLDNVEGRALVSSWALCFDTVTMSHLPWPLTPPREIK